MQNDDRVSRYRSFAVASLEIAQTTKDPNSSASHLVLAQSWTELAKHDFTPGLTMALDAFNRRQLVKDWRRQLYRYPPCRARPLDYQANLLYTKV